MKKVTIIGMGMSPRDLTGTHLELIRNADVLVGGRRHLEDFKDTPARKMAITKKLADLVVAIEKEMKSSRVVVLASGDPLYYGIGARLIKALGEKHVRIYPNITSVAAAFARIGQAWQDAKVVSLHGRGSMRALIDTLKKDAPVAIFTDPKNSPARIAGSLLKQKVTGLELWVFEQMGTDSEKVKRYTLAGASTQKFSSPNMVVLKRSAGLRQAPELVLGTPDHLFAHKRGLITKAEVRTVSLSRLQLAKRHVLWDIGAGSGSVSLEASLFITHGKIFAIEKNESRIVQIEENVAAFKVANVRVVRADYPTEVLKLPAPDRIFIGGGGHGLKAIIKAGGGRLKKNGRIVINTVLLENIDAAVRALKQNGFQSEVVQIQVSHSRKMPWSTRLEAQNPVWIITGYREKNIK